MYYEQHKYSRDDINCKLTSAAQRRRVPSSLRYQHHKQLHRLPPPDTKVPSTATTMSTTTTCTTSSTTCASCSTTSRSSTGGVLQQPADHPRESHRVKPHDKV
eukprot:424254-Amphidinium_carterae.1